MALAVKLFLEADGLAALPWPTCSLALDPIKHALDDCGRAIIDKDNLTLTLHVLAQALTKESEALHIDTIGNIVDSVLRPLDALVLPRVAMLDFGDRATFETVQLNTSRHAITKN